jgi:hypothetical protein
METHPLEVAFHAQTWEQRVDLIRGNHKAEIEALVLSTQCGNEPFKEEDSSCAVVTAFCSQTTILDGYDFQVSPHVNARMMRYFTDRLSVYISTFLGCWLI